ncbi:MAG: glycine zipper 2TM domain-containing protein [Proteobacteria bacterium]|nr:glycine zipper 2TM domain-containing protein [Pseudomonadota bacterium]
MRGQVLLAVSALALAAFAQPASAQQYRSYGDAYAAQTQECQQSHTNRTLGGAAIGGIAGAVAGNNIAGRRHHGDGSLLGAVVGAFVGGAIGNSTANQQPQCSGQVSGNYDPYYGQAQPPYDDRYADNGYSGDDGYKDDDSDLDGGPDGYYSGK